MSNYPEKCHVAGCPCREWSAKSPSESPETPERDAGFLVPEAKNVSTGLETPEMAISAPAFTEEWESAPRWATRTTEQIAAEYWFIRGQHAKEVELLAGMNGDLREMIRVARERIRR